MNANKWLAVAGLSLSVFRPSASWVRRHRVRQAQQLLKPSGAAPKAVEAMITRLRSSLLPRSVWSLMQYPDGPVPGVPGMNAIDERFRPPFTPWGQARVRCREAYAGTHGRCG